MLFEKIKSIVGDAAELDYVCAWAAGKTQQVSMTVKTQNFDGIIVMAEIKEGTFMISHSSMGSDEVDVKTVKFFQLKETIKMLGLEDKPHRAPQYNSPLPIGVVGQ